MGKPLLVYIVAVATTVPPATGSHQDETLDASKGWAETVLVQVQDRIKTTPEPCMRAFLRIRLATFLWKNKPAFIPSHDTIAEQLAEECWVELDAHSDDVVEPYLTQFKRELSALVEIHSPDLATRMKKLDSEKPTGAADPFLTARSLIEEPNGRTKAIGLIGQALASGRQPTSTIFFVLQRLKELAPKEVPQLLLRLLVSEDERPGTLTFESFLWIKQFCLADETPRALQEQFLRIAISSLERQQPDPPLTMLAHQFLAGLLPSIEKISPQLQPRAIRLLAAMKSRASPGVNEQIAAEERLRNSADRLNQLLLEAGATENEGLKDEFLSRAARLAADAKQFARALEIARSISENGEYRNWREGFLRDLIGKALKEKNVLIAKEAASRIQSPANRAAGLQMIASHFFEGGDLSQARENLNEAARVAQSLEDSIDKLRLLLSLGAAFRKIDGLRVGEMFRSAVGVVNAMLRRFDDDTKGKKTRQITTVMQNAWNLFPAFKGLAVFDYQLAALMAAEITDRDLRTCALLGASIGVIEAEKKPASGPGNGPDGKTM